MPGPALGSLPEMGRHMPPKSGLPPAQQGSWGVHGAHLPRQRVCFMLWMGP